MIGCVSGGHADGLWPSPERLPESGYSGSIEMNDDAKSCASEAGHASAFFTRAPLSAGWVTH